nr:hypothetical protein [Tanacetum cinerariifolium]
MWNNLGIVTANLMTEQGYGNSFPCFCYWKYALKTWSLQIHDLTRLHTNFQFVYRIYHDTVRITETDDIVEKTGETILREKHIRKATHYDKIRKRFRDESEYKNGLQKAPEMVHGVIKVDFDASRSKKQAVNQERIRLKGS